MGNWKNEFGLRLVKNNIVLSLSDYSKYKDHMLDLSKNNLENEIYITILDTNKLQSSIFNRCIISDIDKMYYHLILKLIFTMYNLMNNNNEATKYLIVYNINIYPTFLND